jgi:hypothetical protein
MGPDQTTLRLTAQNIQSQIGAALHSGLSFVITFHAHTHRVACQDPESLMLLETFLQAADSGRPAAQANDLDASITPSRHANRLDNPLSTVLAGPDAAAEQMYLVAESESRAANRLGNSPQLPKFSVKSSPSSTPKDTPRTVRSSVSLHSPGLA